MPVPKYASMQAKYHWSRALTTQRRYPILFYKPITSIAGPFTNIRIPQMAQEVDGLDYECELVIVIGRGGSNIPQDKVHDHVLGYAVG